MPPVQESLSELRQRYVVEGRPLPASLQTALEEDGRAGARAILAAVERRRKKNRAEGQRLRKMLRYERALYRKGLTLLAGVDEVGMSPLAGPVVSAAVILPKGFRLARVDDSKKLDAPTRERLAEEIRREAVCFAIGAVEPEEIDRINIYRAGLLSMRRALEGLARTPEHVLIDARRLDEVRLPQTPIIKGDAKSLSIAAASIVAKVHRDNLMVELDARYPGYGLAKHKGYPVKEHQDALRSLGVTPIHRRSFRPVRIAMGIEPEQLELVPGE
ncbi:MAG: ribonuclease HII [Sandaracinaceae bacterium]|nr:MAG: ribonuclease HII [Sandaracinaceae bacterium]